MTTSYTSKIIENDDADPLIGDIFEGKYRIEKMLGKGGMGVVYRATHIFMERTVAIKFLNGDRLADSAAVERFKQEARAAGRIQHPNATTVIDFGLAGNTFYLVMEYLEGRTLRARLNAEKTLTFQEAVRIICQVCEAVEAAHRCNIIHRDLKPDNIFLQLKDGVENVKVLDFGIAKILQDGLSATAGLTAEAVIGTPYYMAPEQCICDPISPSADIYSLGVIIFEMLTGKLPFRGASPLSIALKHLNEPPPSLCKLCPDLPKAVETVILRALSKKAQKRQQSALLLAEELSQALGWTSSPVLKNTASCSYPGCKEPEPSDTGRCLNCRSLLVGALVRQRYEVKRTVGKGGFGTTYLVLDHDCLKETRILKELRLERHGNEEDQEVKMTAERLFKREAEVLLNLQHPSIPKLYAYFTEGGYSYLVQDFIPGMTLSEEIEKRQMVFNEKEVRAVLAELADILEYLHTRTPPIVHRDVKPQNLMHHSSGRLMLIDFGAVCRTASDAALSQTFVGSPGYAPPEQIFGRPIPQSDLYAAGVTAIYLLTGASPSQLFYNRAERLNWQSRTQVSSQFAALLNDLLIPDPNRRLSSTSELKMRLQELEAEPLLVASPLPKSGQALKTAPIDAPSTNSSVFTMIYEEAQESYCAVRPADEAGDLKQQPFLFLLRRLYAQRFSGLLTCISSSIKTIHFDQGEIVFAHSTLKKERLGEILISRGRISRADFDQATAIMESRGLRFGSALIEMGIITAEELKPLIIEQVSNIVYSLFDLTAGRYEIRRDRPPNESTKIPLSIENIIFEGLRRMENIDLVKSWLGDFTRKLTLTADPLLLYQVINLNPKEAFIVSRIDTILSVEEVISLSGLPEAETLKTLCGLLVIGILEWVDEDVKMNWPGPYSANLSSGHQPLNSGLDIQNAAAFCYEVESTLRSIEYSNHYGVLGVERGASDEEIREAYAQMAKKFHPDRHAQLTIYNLNLRAELEMIYTRISEAYRVLGNQANRDEYDRLFRSGGKMKVFRAHRG